MSGRRGREARRRRGREGDRRRALNSRGVNIALLRAVNVGGTKPVPMPALREAVVELGFGGVRTLLQSGNLVFDGGGRTSEELERRLEEQAAGRLDLETDIFVRTAPEWKSIIARNPFTDEAERDPGHLVLMVLRDAANPEDVKALQAAIAGPEIVRAGGKHLYIVYPAGIGRSRLSNALMEKRLSTRGTGRNWNTVLKLAALAET
jgi:uncharacterized protein (DUF1697 family)